MAMILMLLIPAPPDADIGRVELVIMRPDKLGAMRALPGWDRHGPGRIDEIVKLPTGRPFTGRERDRLERRHPGHRLTAVVWKGGPYWVALLQPR